MENGRCWRLQKSTQLQRVNCSNICLNRTLYSTGILPDATNFWERKTNFSFYASCSIYFWPNNENANIYYKNDFIHFTTCRSTFCTPIETPPNHGVVERFNNIFWQPKLLTIYTYIFGTNTQNRARPRTFSKMWSA